MTYLISVFLFTQNLKRSRAGKTDNESIEIIVALHRFYITTVYDEMNQPCAHWARSWQSPYGVRRNPGIFFYLLWNINFWVTKKAQTLPIQTLIDFFHLTGNFMRQLQGLPIQEFLTFWDTHWSCVPYWTDYSNPLPDPWSAVYGAQRSLFRFRMAAFRNITVGNPFRILCIRLPARYCYTPKITASNWKTSHSSFCAENA